MRVPILGSVLDEEGDIVEFVGHARGKLVDCLIKDRFELFITEVFHVPSLMGGSPKRLWTALSITGSLAFETV